MKEYVTKSVTRNVEQSGMIKKPGEDGVEVFGRKIVQKQINDGPVQQRVYVLDSIGGDQLRKITYEPDHENDLEKEAKSKEGYYYKEIKTSSGRKINQELEKDQEGGIEQKIEQGRSVQDKEQMNADMQNKIKFITKEQMLNQENEGKIVGRGQHIEYAYEEENSNSQIQQENEQEIDGQHQKIIIKEEVQPDGQIRKVQYIYKEQNLPQGQIISQEQKTIIHSQSQQGTNINLSNVNSAQKQSPKSLQEENFRSQQKLYIKEISNFEPSPEQNRLKYVTLKKKDNQDEEESQPQDAQPQDAQQRQIIMQSKE